uniref:glutamate synthase (ferredoxin) n=1 Tax=Oryza rufipogon TaxID=4529 RepID=A0A0E0QC76_ORYRU
MATLPRAAAAAAPSPAAALLPLPRAAPLLAGRAAARSAARRLRARGTRAPPLAAARRGWGGVSPRAVLDLPRRREAAEKPAQKAADLNEILSERGACGVGFVANLKNEPSFNIVRDALVALGCMEHRGGCGADNDSGDGSGLMSGIPWDLFNDWAKKQGLAPLDRTNTGVGMVFLPQDENSMEEAKAVVAKVFTDEGLEVLGWRTVPFNVSVVGRYAKETMPNIQQIFVKVAKEDNADDIERELYICRKLIERATKSASWADELYFCSLSSRTIVYKGMLRSEILGQFYLDLQNELYKSPFAIYHRRYSTNTSPRWPLAQPMRLLGHNGEINTIQGNLNWMRSREATLQSPVWRGREHEIRPFGDPKASDSANLDSTAELLLRSGRSPAEAMMILVPEAYKNHPTLSIKYPEVIDFYDYYKGQMEAWDGPALLLFSDGRTVGACLDRNGLRPARYWRTSDDFVYVASEVGVIPMDESKVVMKGRLGPGMMITVDLQTGQVLENTEVKKSVASANPYGSWLQQSTRSIKPVNFQSSVAMDNETVLRHQQAFGYSSEDVQMVIETMASQGKEPTFCMGDDIPLAVLSQKPHMLFDYFKQRFAQVTNPAIDPLREGLVMSLEVNIGKRRNILEVGPENADQVTLSSPVLNEGELESLLNDSKLKPKVLSTYFDIRKGLDGSLDKAIKVLCDEADAAVRNGSQLLVLSDRSEALEPTRPAIPILLAVGAIHQHLIQNGLRMSASIVADTAQCFSTHQFACLIGYGASAICPYLALETCRQWRLSNKTVNLMRNGKMPTVTIEQAQRNFIKAVKSGLLKILSKMGISLLSSYCGAQIFEIYGLGQEVVDLAFCGSVSKIGGLTLDELGRETLSFWVKAFSEDTAKRLENFGFIQSRPGGEYHANNPEMSKLLHKAVREKSDNAYTVYQQHLASRPVNVLRDLLELKSDRAPIPIGKVEPATSIVERFCTGGMSLGAISRETHEAIAIAMNRIGGKSNSGEGDVEDGYSPTLPHLKGLQNGDTATSAIKQVMMVALELAQLVQSSMLGVLGNLVFQKRTRVDGGFRSGLDVLMAAAMGADEYGFGSVAMIATGCVMARICHTNNCPVGVASQREELRARFPGVPGDLVNYFLFVAEEVRATLAQLGFEKLDDIIGRTDILKAKHVSLAKTQHIDLKYLLSSAGLPKWSSSQIRSQDVHSNGPVLDETILADPDISDAIENEKEVSKTFQIYNVDRAVCGRVAGVIAKKYGDTGFAGQLNITFTGSAGQSFGCFLTPGMNIRLVGEANDYVGKGMAGGELVVVPVEKTGFVPEDAAIVFVRGKTGERFAVRNSLGQAVVEGTGDHCCEYMTGGCVVVLGKVGRNVAAGMTGGLAYILDEDDTLVPKVNKEIVKMQRVNAPAGQMQLKGLIEAYVEKTGSEKGATILREWEAYLPLFWQLVPPSEEDSPEACAEFERVLAKQATTVQSAK